MNVLLLLPVVLPILAGVLILLIPEKVFQSRKQLIGFVTVCMTISVLLAIAAIMGSFGTKAVYFHIVDEIPVYLHVDSLGKLFASIVCIVMFLACIFSFGYMAHEENEKRYYGFYLITFGVLMGLDFAGNLVTMYLFYELMTIVSVPLVLHSGSREAIMAGLKYLMYSFCGAYMALFGIYFLYKYADITAFTPGGALNTGLITADGNTAFMLAVVFFMILGFGVKAGMFPLHAWLPTAHPVAPAPASAVLSGIIVKSGVLAIIRVVFYTTGADFIRGTWVQTVWIILTLITILMGSCLAYKEKILKKRLAYSTVSNLSYILFGLALLNPVGMTGSLLHVVFHALIKCALFLSAGAIIVTTGKTKVEQLKEIGKQMPVLLWSYTIASLALIGIPPTSGVVSKWFLATGAFDSQITFFSWFGPVVLLISALLTAGYLLSISINGFLAGEVTYEKKEPALVMLVPIMILAFLTFILGICPTPLIKYISGMIIAGIM